MDYETYVQLIDRHQECVTKVIGALKAAVRNKEINPTPTLVRLLVDLDEATYNLEQHERTHEVFSNPKSKG